MFTSAAPHPQTIKFHMRESGEKFITVDTLNYRCSVCLIVSDQTGNCQICVCVCGDLCLQRCTSEVMKGDNSLSRTRVCVFLCVLCSAWRPSLQRGDDSEDTGCMTCTVFDPSLQQLLMHVSSCVCLCCSFALRDAL